MHVVIVSMGTRGDAQPYIALAKEIAKAGHRVTFVCNDDHAALAEAHGVPFRGVNGSFLELVESPKGRAWLESGDSLSRYIKTTRELFDELQYPWGRNIHDAAADADLVVCHPYCWGAIFAAEKRGVPYVVAPLWPFVATRHTSMMRVPVDWKWVVHLVWRKGLEQASAANFDGRTKLRAELGLPPHGEKSFYAELATDARWVHLFSESIIPRPQDWPDNVRVAGTCFLDTEDYEPPPDLADFLASGPPPIYVGFGSMTGRDPEQLTRTTVDAIARAKVRAIVVTGWGGVDRTYLSGDVLALHAVPHDWLFPKVRAVVHHGGAGTTAEGLRAGRPTQVVSFFGDQPGWGRRVAALGAGPPLIHRTALTAERLGDGIRRVTSVETYAEGAARVAKALAAERGAERAAEAILA